MAVPNRLDDVARALKAVEDAGAVDEKRTDEHGQEESEPCEAETEPLLRRRQPARRKCFCRSFYRSRRIQGDQFKVFAANCTHLGCPVRWFEESQLFLCPCHGGAFYADGAHAAGPPPRGLYVYEHKVENGELQIKAGNLPTLASPS